jgi:hypothetical protein
MPPQASYAQPDPNIVPQGASVPSQAWTPPPRVDAAPAQEKPKKGRKKKNAEVIDGSAPAQQEETDEEGFTLYIGCMPIGCEYTAGIDYAHAANELVGQENNVPHYGAIEYGRGKAMLQHALARVLDSNDPLTGDVVLMSSDIERDVQTVFRSRAAKIVVGVMT